MSFFNLLRVLKGGSGSGNFGHSGRPGKRGGSAPKSAFGPDIKFVDSLSDLKSTSQGKAYYILPDNRVVDVMASGGDHAFAAMKLAKYDKRYVVPENERENYGDYTTKAVAKGAIRVREVGGKTYITTESVDTKTLKKLQTLVDKGKLNLAENGNRWAINKANASADRWLDFDYGDFMFAKRVVDNGSTIKLKYTE